MLGGALAGITVQPENPRPPPVTDGGDDHVG
jgi:hypothetical protein